MIIIIFIVLKRKNLFLIVEFHFKCIFTAPAPAAFIAQPLSYKIVKNVIDFILSSYISFYKDSFIREPISGSDEFQIT